MATAHSVPVVIVGLGSVVGLQTARTFATAGVPVIGLAGSATHFATRTNACTSLLTTDVHGPALLDSLVELGPTLPQGAVLVPVTDQSVLQVSAHRSLLQPWYRMALPEHDVVEALMDKGLFASLTKRLGIGTPRTRIITDPASAVAASEELTFPLVAKPPVKSPAWRRLSNDKVHLLRNPSELQDLVRHAIPTVPTLVVQEYVAGDDDQLYTFNGYFDSRSQPVATFVSRKRRQWPPHLGIASFAEPSSSPELEATATQLFSEVGFRGLGYLEAKVDPAAGGLAIIEANIGRPTGRSSMAEANGVPLLMTMYADALGLPRPCAVPLGPGGRAGGPNWVNTRRDAMASYVYWRRGDLSVRQWLSDVSKPAVHAVWSLRDPLPFVLEVAQSVNRVARRLLPQVSRRQPLRPAYRAGRPHI